MNNYFILIVWSLSSFLKEIFYFPFWWYTEGVFNLAKILFSFLKSAEKYFALWIWIKNILKPMYAQYNLSGIIISFLIRSAQIIFRGTILILLALISLLILIGWLILPIIVFKGILTQLK